jgi:phage shock protein A
MKRFQVQLSDVRKSREQWKERAQYTAKELEQMKAEVERLRKQVEQAVEADFKKI